MCTYFNLNVVKMMRVWVHLYENKEENYEKYESHRNKLLINLLFISSHFSIKILCFGDTKTFYLIYKLKLKYCRVVHVDAWN